MPTSPVSAVLEVLRRDSRLHHEQGAVVAYLMDLLYYGEFQIFEQVASGDGGEAVNLIGKKGAGEAQDALWLVAHLSTGAEPVPGLPLGPEGDPFAQPRVDRKSGATVGLGACSGKVDAVLKILAASRLRMEELKRPVCLVLVSGEEARGGTLRQLLETQRPRAAVVGAATGLDLWSAHPGCVTLELTVQRRIRHRRMPPFRGAFELTCRGSSRHVQAPGAPEDALGRGFELLEILKRVGDLRLLSLEAGEGANRVAAVSRLLVATSFDALPALPAWASGAAVADGTNLPFPIGDLVDAWFTARDAGFEAIEGELRIGHNPQGACPSVGLHTGRLWSGRDELRGSLACWTGPGVDAGELVERFASAVEHALAGRDEIEAEIHLTQDRPAYQLDEVRAAPLLAVAADALRKARVEPRVTRGLLTSDAGILSSFGVPTVVMGPGDGLHQLYREGEQVLTAELDAAVLAYHEIIARHCAA